MGTCRRLDIRVWQKAEVRPICAFVLRWVAFCSPYNKPMINRLTQYIGIAASCLVLSFPVGATGLDSDFVQMMVSDYLYDLVSDLPGEPEISVQEVRMQNLEDCDEHDIHVFIPHDR